MRALVLFPGLSCVTAGAHDAHGHSAAPPEARLLQSPIPTSDEQAVAAQPVYDRLCAGCHGTDGKARTPIAAKLPVRPTNLSEYLMESMRDGEIFWVITNGVAAHVGNVSFVHSAGEGQIMPPFGGVLDETQRWQLVQYVRRLRAYMHDGSIRTLDEVVKHYSSGGRTIKAGPNSGVGSENPNQSEFVKPFDPSSRDKADILAFLGSLTDRTVLADRSLSNPFTPASQPAPKENRSQ